MHSKTVDVHLITPVSTDPRADLLCLPEHERVRAARFQFKEDAAHWIACRAALRRILGKHIGLKPIRVPIMLTEFGKPVLSDGLDHIDFSLSHCDDLALLAISGHGPVGIDLEPLERAPELIDCIETFCHPDEIRSLPQIPDHLATRLLEIWTAKEAVLKAMGTGFSYAPEHVRIQFSEQGHTCSSDRPMEGINDHIVIPLQHPGFESHCVHLCAPRHGLDVRILENTGLHVPSAHSGQTIAT